MTVLDQVQSVPLLDLKAQYAAIRREIQPAIDRVLESQYFILGPEVSALEEEVAAYSQCRYGIGVSSGTDALLVALAEFLVGGGQFLGAFGDFRFQIAIDAFQQATAVAFGGQCPQQQMAAVDQHQDHDPR